MVQLNIYCLIIFFSLACSTGSDENIGEQDIHAITEDSVNSSAGREDQPAREAPPIVPEFNGVGGHQLVEYAKTLIGTPYLYASTDPSKGFDCSGFIAYVFNHFNINVPRSSVGFTDVGMPLDVKSARQGDLILFTGTADSIRVVGHMGIVTENADTLRFIHSTSGKANGVTITTLNERYKKRFVKVIRVLAE